MMSSVHQCRLEVDAMKLKKDVDIKEFMDVARKCSGDVFLQTTEEDILNLKSLLSQYVLMSIMGHRHLLERAQIVCVQEEDYQKLTDFLEESE